LLEVFKQVRSRMEEASDLRVDVLDRLLLALVCLKDFQELLVDLGFVLEAILAKELATVGD
jgi:hypothetical protein